MAKGIDIKTINQGDRVELEIEDKKGGTISRFGTFLTREEGWCLLDEPVLSSENRVNMTSYKSVAGNISSSPNDDIFRSGVKFPAKDKVALWPAISNWYTTIKRVLPKDGEIKASDLVRGDRIELGIRVKKGAIPDLAIKATYLGDDWFWLDQPVSEADGAIGNNGFGVHSADVSDPSSFGVIGNIPVIKNSVLSTEKRLWHLSKPYPELTKILRFLPETSNLVEKAIVPLLQEEVSALQTEVRGLKSELSEAIAELRKIAALNGSIAAAPIQEPPPQEEKRAVATGMSIGLAMAGIGVAMAGAMLNKTPSVRVPEVETKSFADGIAEAATVALKEGAVQ